MRTKKSIKNLLNAFLKRYGHEIVETQNLYEWQRVHPDQQSWSNYVLSEDAAEYLRPNNPVLTDLQQRYRSCDPEVTAPFVWTDDHVHPEHLAYFRGDNAWVWQLRGRRHQNILAYAISYYYLKTIDNLSLLERLVEDNSFGNFTFRIAGQQVSRDLLDSIAEIYFLDRHLGIGSWPDLRVLDIGAGYGRLAHRMSILPGIGQFFCTDAIAVSTFVSEFYLQHRKVDKAIVVPLDRIAQLLGDQRIDIAVNIHSFSECRTDAIRWWARLLCDNRIKNLMITPNRSQGEHLLTNDGQDFLPILEHYGYRTVAVEPKFLDPVVQEYGLYPVYHHLLELRA